MNEKELRERWREACLSTEEIELLGELHPRDIKTIADWFIAYINERDEKLKKAILANTGLQNDECCMGITVFSANDVLKIIDNHA